MKLIINFSLILAFSACSFKMGKLPKEKMFNTSERASYLIKRSKALRYKGEITESIKLLESASLNFLASGKRKEFFLTNVKILILSLTHDKKREYENEIKELENYNMINNLMMDIPLTIVKSYFYFKRNKKKIALEVLNNYELTNTIDDLRTKIYFLSVRIEISDFDVKKELILSLDRKCRLYEKNSSDDSGKKINLELLSKASFNLGQAFLKLGDLKKSNFWLLKNYEINKGLQHYVKLIPTLKLLKVNFENMGLKGESNYYKNLEKFYVEFLNSL